MNSNCCDDKPSKIQIRAQVLQSILKFKNSSLPADCEVEECIDFFNKIEDKEFLASLLVKEISGVGTVYDNVLALILLNTIEPKLLSNFIFETLCDNSVNDAKKLFLINLLREQGQNVDYNFIQSCVSNPDEVIDSETKKFLEDAKINPEIQIDFFDFYFTVNEQDKKMLTYSMMEDYSGDELANILAPFFYFHPENCVSECIINAMEMTKSPLAYEPLVWYSNNSSNKELATLAKKAVAKLKLSGAIETLEKRQIYSRLLEGSTPLGFWFSLSDGNSDVSCVFARKRDDDTIQTFFTVFNLECGAVSCFGFNEISQDEFDVVMLRFFKSSLSASIPLQEGKIIFEYLADLSWQKANRIPYEFICWRQLTYDVEPAAVEFDTLIQQGVKKRRINKKVLHNILNSEIFSNWFFSARRFEKFDSLIKELEDENILEISQVEHKAETLLNLLLSDKEFKSEFLKKLFYQAYILRNANMQSSADSLGSVTFDENAIEEFLEHIIKNSIYQHFLLKLNLAEYNQTTNIFLKKRKEELDCTYANALIPLIEEHWINE